MAKDPYSELGVARGASEDDIRKAFRKLAKDLHPDRNPGDKKAEERFKRVSAAFDILGDPEKRAKFDRGQIDADGRETSQGFGGFGGGGGNPFRRGFGGAEFYNGGGGRGHGEAGAGEFDDILSEMFGRAGQGARNFAFRGSDVKARLDVDLEDVIAGASRRVSFSDGRQLEVTIPRGAATGQVLRLRGQGMAGRNGGAPGDALIELRVREHPIFRLDGADLHMDLPVSIPDAVLGAKVEAPTPDGPVKLSVPSGSNSGAVLRLKGRGAVDAATLRRGDLFAHLQLVLPDAPDPELVRFCETWRRERPYKPGR